MPFVVVSKDQAFTPEAARRLSKPIVMLQGGIHAGEIDGKDALLLLLRDLALGLHPAVLDRVTLLVVPIYNVDGHERVSRFNRSNQDGPEEGMGFRTNARGLDLNRDHLKLDSAEARALIALVNAWRPHLHVDNHVSDGFDHAWVVGYATAEAPQAAPSIDAWAKANLPAVAEATRSAGHPIGPYLELLSSEEPLKGAITPPYRPRYSTGYFALRNRPSILIETHSHKPFRTRVLGNYAWLAALARAGGERAFCAGRSGGRSGEADGRPGRSGRARIRRRPALRTRSRRPGRRWRRSRPRAPSPLCLQSLDLGGHGHPAHDLQARPAARKRPALVPHAASDAVRAPTARVRGAAGLAPDRAVPASSRAAPGGTAARPRGRGRDPAPVRAAIRERGRIRGPRRSPR